MVTEAAKIIDSFNHSGIISSLIQLNHPEIWSFTDPPHAKILVEPFIDNWVKFNSNTGWAIDDNPQEKSWPNVLQALSHFSYHNSGVLVLRVEYLSYCF